MFFSQIGLRRLKVLQLDSFLRKQPRTTLPDRALVHISFTESRGGWSEIFSTRGENVGFRRTLS